MRLGPDNSPASCAVRIRHILKFLDGYMNAKVKNLINDISRALADDPDGKVQLPDQPNMDRPYD